MKKSHLFYIVSLSIFFLTSCAQIKKTPAPTLAPRLSKSDVVQKEEAAPKRAVSAENTHELVDVTVADEDIKREIGESDLDEELSSTEAPPIPYSRKFLTLKKTKRMKFWVEYFTKNQRERFQRFINNGQHTSGRHLCILCLLLELLGHKCDPERRNGNNNQRK